MSKPTIAAWPSSEKRNGSRRVRYRPPSPERMEKIFGPGPGDVAVMTRSCQRVVANDLGQLAVRRSTAQKGFPWKKVAQPSRRLSFPKPMAGDASVRPLLRGQNAGATKGRR